MHVAAVQLNSTEDLSRNLARAEELVEQAAADGASLIVLPERFNLRGSPATYRRGAEGLAGETVAWAARTARRLEVDIVAGSLAEHRRGHDKLSNSSVHVGPDGELRAVYRKVHLFDVTVGETEYRESECDEPGDRLVISETADGTTIGLSVCYDLRFPELYRALALEGALIATVPANFTSETGAAHWEVLLRARAIEDGIFVIAAAQAGASPTGSPAAFGNSMIVDPWGEVLARAGEREECFVVAELDPARQSEIRERLPSLRHRLPEAYRVAVGVGS
ncbi:MAG: carbon-nitrogen hydrolase family protein [Thermoleophilaceae bacterium]